MIANPFAGGDAQAAEYHEQEIPAFRGNPDIEALPPIRSREEARAAMAWYPEYSPDHRALPAHIREHMAAGLDEIRHPVGVHLEFESRVSRLIRWGYVARNRIHPRFQATLNARETGLRVAGKGSDLLVTGAPGGFPPSARGLTLLGGTGNGKTRMVEMTLGQYPQLILHREYGGRPFTETQVVWLSLQCPSDGSILTLCNNFFVAMDALHAALPVPTTYHRDYVPSRPSIQRLIPSMARLAAQHALGLLIIEEVQDLNERGSRAILSFLVQLVNTIGVPVMIVGGVDAAPVLSRQFRQARRGATEGDMVLDRAQPGSQWRALCEVFWRFQYTREDSPLTDDIVAALYEESQGITQYLALLCKQSQIAAIANGRERVTPALVRAVARSNLTQAGPVLRALKQNKIKKLREFGDVLPPDGMESVPFVRGDAPLQSRTAASATADAPRRRKAAAAPAPEPVTDSTAPSPPSRTKRPPPPEGSLPAVAKSAGTEGVHEALAEKGLVRAPIWDEVVGSRPTT